MDKSFGQAVRPGRGPGSSATRDRLMAAAVQLIGELGWGRVTTRAVAERAGLPHGAVSYHFHGKQELLVEAALHAFADALPMAEFEQRATVDDLVTLIATEIGDAVDPVLSRLMLETMREAERDPALRERMGGLLGSYRDVMIGIVRADQSRGTTVDDVAPEAIATLLAAVGDGLVLHALLDPDLDVRAAVDALRALLRPAAGRGAPRRRR